MKGPKEVVDPLGLQVRSQQKASGLLQRGVVTAEDLQLKAALLAQLA